ncbi:glutathione S-transferase C-terminal domain-containing protein [Moritella sp. F3]|uniref:glutathione S-transferase C-terminal domain-containing protein n=1 Tax=Moritella sp. F3 TaxID=2718882 RepID=UPI0018E16860|nr:glutathione S-transferase C-terminal domain-containing protein [Moritella sp. F3]GIC77022.1 glutathione-dependent reductase [Moritella sp. F1]GIC80204.1 glutathione-dependent reductase [Moritella sp. F3]
MAVLDKGKWYKNKEERDLSVVDNFHLPEVIESDRYHLYISLACPFAHRPYLVINYLGLNDAISISTVAAKRYEDGWLFDNDYPDTLNNASSLVSLYQRATPTYSGRVTVPILWDKKEGNIVGNDSAYMATDFATNWLSLAKNPVQLIPESKKAVINELNLWLHAHVNTGVYGVGFASNQVAYDNANMSLFKALDKLDNRLADKKYLLGSDITLSDLFLFPTLVRFEAVYEVHFKANKKTLKYFKNLYRYMLDLVSISSIRETIDIDYIKLHYYYSHRHINPTGIIPAGPELHWYI